MNLFDVYPLYQITPKKAQGVYVYDEKDQKYLDLYGGHAVISIGHAHPAYVKAITDQVQKLGFYSNSVKNPLQQELAVKLELISGCNNYKLFLCNSGAEANENALKLASFHTGRQRVIYFEKAFHGRTSGTVTVTDNENIKSLYNLQHSVTKLPFNDIEALENEIRKGDVAAVILETIQGVGGLNEASTDFYKAASELCEKFGTVLIADEVQSGYGRTGDFFAFQKHGIRPDIISVAKGMGNGFPIGGIMIDEKIKPSHGMLGTTFGGNHLACAAGISVLEILEEENLLANAVEVFRYFQERTSEVPKVKELKGRGLMIGLKFDFDVTELRKELLFKHRIFTGAASDKTLLRILPPMIIQKEHVDQFFFALKIALIEPSHTN